MRAAYHALDGETAGLGRSSTATYYGLAGVEEAADYLRDRVRGDRLVT